LRALIVGFESGSDEILRRIKKGTTVEQAKRFARDAKKAGMLVHGDFIVGLPGETRETIEATWRLIKEIKPEILQISIATPFLGTEFYEWLKQNGYLKVEDPVDYPDEHGHQKSVINYPSLSAEEIQQAVNRMLVKYYLSPSYIPPRAETDPPRARLRRAQEAPQVSSGVRELYQAPNAIERRPPG
jgi:radical SAM superfamily enzyme YgiQ (UPF0313 family)